MRCISPQRILVDSTDDIAWRVRLNSKTRYRGNKIELYVPCGKCFACLKKKRHDWIIRLQEESFRHSTPFFVTLTYDDPHVNLKICEDIDGNIIGIPILVKKDFQDFIKRLRHQFSQKFKYYGIGEYGSNTYRPHYHFLIFLDNIDFQTAYDRINESWQKGFIYIGQVETGSIKYITKYCITKPSEKIQCIVDSFDIQPPFMLCSKGMGIGYVHDEFGFYLDRNGPVPDHYYYPDPKGFKYGLPRYYKEKLFTKDQIAALNAIQDYEEEDLDFDTIKLREYRYMKQLIKSEKL